MSVWTADILSILNNLYLIVHGSFRVFRTPSRFFIVFVLDVNKAQLKPSYSIGG